MPFFAWQDRYDVNISSLDEQHRGIAGMINNLYDSLEKGVYNDETVGSVLIPIVECLKYHFQTEEKMMMESNYEEYHYHKSMHDRFTDEVMLSVIKIKKGEQVNAREILTMIRDWLLTHIEEEDRKLTPVLSQSSQPK
ncbi:MAG: hemerythrin family protein [candidate division Zixibacteria bacterium]|nr:hemerythrin family protein [candidate division Zixibacteria bacterium]NIR64198.1 hemerythrin family protein [candidate division Zixibacteria bacterium]NIS15641.1 hemerythrin family protein [candidate division Zixibacteria bacterium]NIS46090.1 hemerythrin family protein [candidate division Zixibacteria bacterium]NIT52149.1 hemerythrin family protein [candidate division Zixibacteria bacterium]